MREIVEEFTQSIISLQAPDHIGVYSFNTRNWFLVARSWSKSSRVSNVLGDNPSTFSIVCSNSWHLSCLWGFISIRSATPSRWWTVRSWLVVVKRLVNPLRLLFLLQQRNVIDSHFVIFTKAIFLYGIRVKNWLRIDMNRKSFFFSLQERDII